MKRFRLKNGLTVIHKKRDSDSVSIEVCVCTGSNNESKDIAGISHFLEHMLFEGTKTRTSKQISEAIENVGGELNAATSNERTFFYIKLPKNKLDVGLDILSDMIKNPAFIPDVMEKERKVILEEIKMVNDQPTMYRWILFEKTIFKKHPTKNPVYGSLKSVKSITRKQMSDYFKKWYVPKNIILSIVGDVKGIKSKVKTYFNDMPSRPSPKFRKVKEPEDKRITIKREKRDISQAYMALGYKTVPRTHKDSTVLDVISAIFSKGLSGRINDEIRVKKGLAYSVGAGHETKKDFGFFVFYLNCSKKNIELCKKLILEEVTKLGNLEKKELEQAKEHIIGRILLDNENSQRFADELAFWEFIQDAKLADKYLKNVKNVSVNDILNTKKKYFNNNYTMVVLEGK